MAANQLSPSPTVWQQISCHHHPGALNHAAPLDTLHWSNTQSWWLGMDILLGWIIYLSCAATVALFPVPRHLQYRKLGVGLGMRQLFTCSTESWAWDWEWGSFSLAVQKAGRGTGNEASDTGNSWAAQVSVHIQLYRTKLGLVKSRLTSKIYLCRSCHTI